MLWDDGGRHLDLDFILSRIQVHTPYGEEEKRRLRIYPPDEVEQLADEFDRIEAVVALLGSNRFGIVEIRNQFKRVRNLTGTFQRLRDNEVLSVTEIFEIKTLVNVFAKLALHEEALNWAVPQDLKVTPLPVVERMLDPEDTGTGTFYIYDAYSEELSDVRKRIAELERRILQERKRQRENLEAVLGLRFRPGGDITVPKQDKELIARLTEVPELAYNSETYVNMTFQIRPSALIDGCETEIGHLKSSEEEAEYAVRQALSRDMSLWIDAIQGNAEAIGRLDLLLAKAAFAVGFHGVKPELSREGELVILSGRHLRVEHHLAKDDKVFTPVSLEIKRGVTCITGANMGGKTVSLKLVGMLSMMAQMGLFVPAERMVFTPQAFIFISVGDEQDADKGLSTFGAEMQKIGRVLQVSGNPGLILIDELARGTNPKEGFAISRAILNHLKNGGATSVITTHFDGLADDSDICHLQVTGLSGVDFETLRLQLDAKGVLGIDAVHQLMDYRLRVIHGPEEVPKDAINISRLMGLEEKILDDAKKILEAH